ncbi:MAG: sensor histidine kinase [Firmicutes bacterium]|nr:sensor histidine kinase [Bacillota bacterium]
MKNLAVKDFWKYCKRKYYNAPLNWQINVVIGFIILVTILTITIITYVRSVSYIKQSLKETGLILLKETANKIDSRLKLIENTALMISNDSRIQNYTGGKENITESEINKYLISSLSFNKYDVQEGGMTYVQNLIDDIILMTEKGTVIARRIHFSTYDIRSQLDNYWFRKALKNKGKLIWTDCFYNDTAEQISKDTRGNLDAQLNQFMLIRYMMNEKTFEDIGYLAISINLENLSRLIDNITFGKNGKLYIIDANGKVLASKDRSQLLKTVNFNPETMSAVTHTRSEHRFFQGLIGQEQYFIFAAPLSINDWKLIVTLPAGELANAVSGTLFSVVFIGIISFFVITFISTFILNNISFPLKKILTTIKEIRKGDLSQKVNVNGCIEVNQLSTEFNFMLDKINNLLSTIVDEQNALRKSQLKALRAQINPHFLYNTLDSIKWLICSGDHDKAAKLISSLSSFFRLGLSGGNEEILIKEEIEHVRNYLFIQKLRCGENLSYLIDVEPEIEDLKTPKLILQPIVENAIMHGLNQKEGQGLIKIIVRRKDPQTILYEIIDTGKGMKPEKLDALNQKIKAPLLQSTAERHGYAVRNVNQRIKLSYGEKYGICYKSKYNTGTKACITIPAVPGP